MPTVYGASPSPFVRKVRVFLAEKSVPYELDEVFPPAADRALSPLGKIPYFRDGNTVLADSSVICAYVERTHPKPALYPADPYEFARALWFEEYGDGGLTPIVGAKIFFAKIVGPRFFNQPTDDAALRKAIDEELPPFLDYLESQLGGRDWLAGGQFSIGDISIGSQFMNLRHAGVGVDTQRWPQLARYIARVHERPSFREVVANEHALLGTAA